MSETITALDELAAGDVAPDDVLPIVDVGDFTQAPTGSTKKVTVAGLFTDVPDPSFTGTAIFENIDGEVIHASEALTTGPAPASTGPIRLSNNTSITARNAADSGDLTLIGTSSGNAVVLAGGAFSKDFTTGITTAQKLTIAAQSGTNLYRGFSLGQDTGLATNDRNGDMWQNGSQILIRLGGVDYILLKNSSTNVPSVSPISGTASVQGTDTAGVITFTPGGTGTTSMVTLTFAVEYANVPTVVVSNASANWLPILTDGESETGFAIAVDSGTNYVGSTVYKFSYVVTPNP